jgi:hypothetical protein
LVVKPLHGALVHGIVLSLTVHRLDSGAKLLRPWSRFVDFGEGSETCAPVMFVEAKRPSRSANHRSPHLLTQ